MMATNQTQVKHTPGPWAVVDRYSDGLSVVDADGFEHVECPNTAILLDYGEKLRIAHWARDPRAFRDLSEAEQRANARLIAAAPDLLEAAAEVFSILEQSRAHQCAGWDCAVCQPSVMREKLLAAIVKATGEQP